VLVRIGEQPPSLHSTLGVRAVLGGRQRVERRGRQVRGSDGRARPRRCRHLPDTAIQLNGVRQTQSVRAAGAARRPRKGRPQAMSTIETVAAIPASLSIGRSRVRSAWLVAFGLFACTPSSHSTQAVNPESPGAAGTASGAGTSLGEDALYETAPPDQREPPPPAGPAPDWRFPDVAET